MTKWDKWAHKKIECERMEEVFGKKIKMKVDITHFVLGLKKSIER